MGGVSQSPEIAQPPSIQHVRADENSAADSLNSWLHSANGLQ